MSGACTTGDCDNPIDPNGFVRLNDCDCLGDPEVFPNCNGHTYCKKCTDLLVWGGEFAGCVWCSSGHTLVSHGRGHQCTNGPTFSNRCARCGAFVAPYDIKDMKVCDACDYVLSLQSVLEDTVRAWKAYDSEDAQASHRWEDDMNDAVNRAIELLP